MKKLLIFLLMSLQCLAMEKEMPAQDDEIIVLWDLGGIHWDSDKGWLGGWRGLMAWQNLGTMTSNIILEQRKPSKATMYDALNKFPLTPEKGFKNAWDESSELPYVLSAYQAGRITAAQVREMAKTTLAELRLKGFIQSQRHQELVQGMIDTTFNPANHDYETIICPEGIEILKEIDALKKSGKKIKQVALSNWDSESFALVKARFPEEMALFDDIIISGDIKTVKPNEAAFEAVLKRHGSNKKKYIFVDDTEKNIKAAKEFGITNSLLFTKGDYYTLRKQLKELGVLTKMPEQKILTKSVKIATALAITGVALLWLA